MKPFKKTVLSNGLRIITVPQEGLSATILVLVEAGSKYEVKKINGISHFLEHMAFKGTEKRPTALAISSELDQLGAAYNAFTGQEYTGYFVKAKSEFLDGAIDVVADLYSHSTLNEEELEKEKGVIIEELNMYEDLPPRRVAELFSELLYGDQPAGWPIGGRKEIIRRLNRKAVADYREKHYVARATAVIVAGAFNEKKIIKELRQAFADISASKKFGKVKTKEKQTKPRIWLQYKKSDQTHLILGCRAFDIFDKRQAALEVMNDILGGGMSSRLFQRVREQLGAAYYVRSGGDLYTDHGYWAAAVGVEHSKLRPVIVAILDEMKKLIKERVSDEELRRAKDHLSGHSVLELESSDSQAMFYGLQEILKKPVLTPKEQLAKIQKVTAGDIKAVAKYIFRNNKLNLALIGPVKNKRILERDLRL